MQGKVSNFDLIYSGGYIHRNVDNVNDYSDYSYSYDAFYTNTYAAFPTYFGDNFRNDSGELINPAQTIFSKNIFTKQSHELRLTSPKEGRLRGVVGLFYQQQTNITRDEYRVANLATALSITGQPGVLYLNAQDRVDKDQAVFAEMNYDLTSRLTATGGLRFFKYRNTVYGFFGYNAQVLGNGSPARASGEGQCTPPVSDANNGVRPCINIDNLASRQGETYKLNLSYKLAGDRLIYGTWSTGFRPGGVNRVANRPSYTPDYLTNFEIGWKFTWRNGGLRFNAAGFLERWKDAQFGITGTNGITEITNAGSARIFGVESDVQWAASHRLLLTGKIDTTPLAVAGSRLPVSLRFKAHLIARYHFPLDSLDAHLRGAMAMQSDVVPALDAATNQVTGNQPGYATFDLSAGVKRGNWSAELFVENAFDRRAEQSRYTSCAADNAA